jgi:hypothetical protein
MVQGKLNTRRFAPVILPAVSNETSHTNPKRKRGNVVRPRWRFGLVSPAAVGGIVDGLRRPD